MSSATNRQDALTGSTVVETDRDVRPSLAEQIPRLPHAQLRALIKVGRAGGRLPRGALRRELAAALLRARAVAGDGPRHLRITELGVLALVRAANPVPGAQAPAGARVLTAQDLRAPSGRRGAGRRPAGAGR